MRGYAESISAEALTCNVTWSPQLPSLAMLLQ